MGYYSKKELQDIGIGYIGKNVVVSNKVSLYEPEKMSFDDNCRIDDFCVLSGKIELGKNVHIAVFCHMLGADEGIYMEDFSGLAFYCNLFTGSDDYSGNSLTNPTIPKQFKSEKRGKIIIKKHCIIGASSTIFPGVTIEEGTAIGAMSLVNKNTESWKIYTGIPAKPIRDRSKKLLELEKEYLESVNY